MNRWHGRALSLALINVCVILGTTGCDREPAVSQYRQEKEAAPPAHPAQGMGMHAAALPATAPSSAGAAGHSHPEGAGLHYTLPEGWKTDPTPRPMREATILVKDDTGSAELVVSRLGSNFGDALSNINRWRGQIGLGPVKEAGEAKPETLKLPNGQDYELLTLEGSDKATLVATWKLPQSTWFFKLTGDKQTVLANRSKFESWINTVEIH